MDNQNDVQDSQGSQDSQDSQNNQGDGIDSIISKVDSYIQDPKLVTPQTLQELKSDLMDLKDYLDGEEVQEGDQSESNDEDNGHGLMVMIGNARKGAMK